MTLKIIRPLKTIRNGVRLKSLLLSQSHKYLKLTLTNGGIQGHQFLSQNPKFNPNQWQLPKRKRIGTLIKHQLPHLIKTRNLLLQQLPENRRMKTNGVKFQLPPTSSLKGPTTTPQAQALRLSTANQLLRRWVAISATLYSSAAPPQSMGSPRAQ